MNLARLAIDFAWKTFQFLFLGKRSRLLLLNPNDCIIFLNPHITKPDYREPFSPVQRIG